MKYQTDEELSTFDAGVHKITLEEDNSNITYISGNNSEVNTTDGAIFSVRVYDLDRNTYNLDPSATVTFHVNSSSYDKIVGTNTTNSTGYAEFYFVPDCQFIAGSQNWYAEINSSDPYYKENISVILNVDISLTGCDPSVEVEAIYSPKEVFQYQNFTINSTIRAWVGDSSNVNVTIDIPTGWEVIDQTQSLGTITAGTTKTLQWNVYPTNADFQNATVFANSSNAGNDTKISSKFVSYKERTGSITPHETLPVILGVEGEQIFSWDCEAGDYRATKLYIGFNQNNSIIHVYSYNNGDCTAKQNNIVLGHTNVSTMTNLSVYVIGNRIIPNETGYCRVKLANHGPDTLNITSLNLSVIYYNETVQIQDIQVKVNDNITRGIETGEESINVTVNIANSINTSYSGTLWLNITNSTGYLMNSSSQSIDIPENSSGNLYNFTDINTSDWAEDTYDIMADFVNDSVSTKNRTETLTVDTVSLSAKGKFDSVNDIYYMCNLTIEPYYVTVNHPFRDYIQYNVTVQAPAGWSSAPSSAIINAASAGNYTLKFDITSSNLDFETVVFNVTLNYTYPASAKNKTINYTFIVRDNISILEVVRETPSTVASDTVFDSQITVYNRGCAPTNGPTKVTEAVSTGWTPANPSIMTNEYGSDVDLISATTDLINNEIVWELGTIGMEKYAVLTYQVKSPASYPAEGSLKYNVTYGTIYSRDILENTPYPVQTFNYTEESHLEFDIETIQQPAYPWVEPRSAQVNVSYNYSLKVANIGDNATGSDWNVTLYIPSECNITQVYDSGIWNEPSRFITWALPDLAPYTATYLNFTANCTDSGSYNFVATGLRDTINYTKYSNDTEIYCFGADCSLNYTYDFTTPPDSRYEYLTEEFNFYMFFNKTGQNMTISHGKINMFDDLGNLEMLRHGFLFPGNSDEISGNKWYNHSIVSQEDNTYVDNSRDILLTHYVDSTYGSNGTMGIEKIIYTWRTGKLFNESQDLYFNVKVYDYSPLLDNSTLYIDGNDALTTGGWGEEFNFSAMVKDRFGRDVTVYVWHKKSAGDYVLMDSWVCTSCASWTQANFTYDYVADNMSTWEFKFNATNADSSTELSGFSYTIEKDDIDSNLILPLNEVTINRSETTVFSIRSYDRDNDTYPTGSDGMILISIYDIDNIDNYDQEPTLTSDNGWINRTMENSDWCADEGKYYLGPEKHGWKGGTYEDSDVKDNITSPINFTLMGTLSNTLVNPDGTSNFTRGAAISFTAAVTDDCQEPRTADSTIILKMSHGAFERNCTALITGSCDINTDSGFPLGWYNVTTISNKTGYNNGFLLNESQFFLRSPIQLDYDSKTPSATEVPWGQSPYNFTVNVTGIDNESVTVYLWMSNSSGAWWIENQTTCTTCENTTFYTTKDFTNDSIAGNIWYFRFNATSSTGYANDTLSQQWFNVTKNQIDLRLFGNNDSSVNRTSAPQTTINLTSKVWDLVLDQDTLDSSTPNITLDEIHFYVFNGTEYVENVTEESLNGTDYIRRHIQTTRQPAITLLS